MFLIGAIFGVILWELSEHITSLIFRKLKLNKDAKLKDLFKKYDNSYNRSNWRR